MTDHNPLIPILNSHRLDEIENPQLQRLRTHLIGYNFTAVRCKGSIHATPAITRICPSNTVGIGPLGSDRSVGLADSLAVALVPADSVKLMNAPMGFAWGSKMAELWPLSKTVGLLIYLNNV